MGDGGRRNASKECRRSCHGVARGAHYDEVTGRNSPIHSDSHEKSRSRFDTSSLGVRGQPDQRRIRLSHSACCYIRQCCAVSHCTRHMPAWECIVTGTTACVYINHTCATSLLPHYRERGRGRGRGRGRETSAQVDSHNYGERSKYPQSTHQ